MTAMTMLVQSGTTGDVRFCAEKSYVKVFLAYHATAGSG